MYNNPNRRVQLSCVSVHFEIRLNQFSAGNVVFMKNDRQINYFVSKYLRRRGRNISKFWVIPLFQHRCSARAGKQQFQWRKRIANFTSKKCKWQQTKSDLSVWSIWLLSTEKNDFNWFTNNNKCSSMSWLQFIAPKRANYKTVQHKVYAVQLLQYCETKKCLHMCACIWKWRENEVTRASNSQSKFSTGIETPQISRN